MGCFGSRQRVASPHVVVDARPQRDKPKPPTNPAQVPTQTQGNEEELKVRPGQFIQIYKGSFLQNYRMIKELGEGAFGKVFLVEHRTTHIRRAVKELDKSKAEKDSHSKFIAEVDILSRLDHPHILKLCELYEDTLRYYVVSEVLTGGELFDYVIKLGHLSEATAAKIMHQILSAVTYCHQNGIVHRDLKPENLLLESQPQEGKEIIIKMIDFGTSSLFSSSSRLHKKIGTPYYIAPEVLNMDYTEKCDVWSCGVILYILLSGYPPFPGKSNEEIMRKVRIGQFHFNHPEFNTISTEAKTLIRKMLVMDQRSRLSAEQALQDPWISLHSAQGPLTNAVTLASLEHLKHFRADEKLKQAALSFITSQLLTQEQTAQIRDVFRSLDRNGDGRLSKDELLLAYRQHNTEEQTQEIVENVMRKVDVDKNGFIDYSEFLAASINVQTLTSKANLEQAFRLFDKDGSGKITIQEVKEILGGDQQVSDSAWQQIMKEVDANSDGEIDLKEFISMMLQSIK